MFYVLNATLVTLYVKLVYRKSNFFTIFVKIKRSYHETKKSVCFYSVNSSVPGNYIH